MNESMKRNRTVLSKDKITKAVASCRGILSWLGGTSLSGGIKYCQIDDIVRTLMTIECFLAYLYTEVCQYGGISDIIDTHDEVYARYTLVSSLVFSEPEAMKVFLGQLTETWKGIMSFVKGLTERENASGTAVLNQWTTTIDKAIMAITNFSGQTTEQRYSDVSHQDSSRRADRV